MAVVATWWLEAAIAGRADCRLGNVGLQYAPRYRLAKRTYFCEGAAGLETAGEVSDLQFSVESVELWRLLVTLSFSVSLSWASADVAAAIATTFRRCGYRRLQSAVFGKLA